MTRVENLLKSIAVLSEDPQIDHLAGEALDILAPRDKRTDKADPSMKKKSRPRKGGKKMTSSSVKSR